MTVGLLGLKSFISGKNGAFSIVLFCYSGLNTFQARSLSFQNRIFSFQAREWDFSGINTFLTGMIPWFSGLNDSADFYLELNTFIQIMTKRIMTYRPRNFDNAFNLLN